MLSAKDAYKEGSLNFPWMCIQRNYQDVQDWVSCAEKGAMARFLSPFPVGKGRG